MRDRNLDALVDKIGSKYTLVVAVAKRAQQVRSGAVPVVACNSQNPVTIALAEIEQAGVLVNPEALLAAGQVEERRAVEAEEDQDIDLDVDLSDSDLGGDDLDVD